MNTDLMDSTRRYARSTSEAFADERSHCIEHCTPRNQFVFKLINLVYIAAIFVLIAVVTVWGGRP